MAAIIDLIVLFLIAGLVWALTSEGLWGAALMFFNVVFSGMIAFNFYEPLAKLIDSTGINWGFSDTLCILGLFCISLGLLRMTTETIAPAMVRFPMPVYHVGRLLFGLGGAVVTIAIIILAFHAAPVHKKIFTTVKFDSKPPFGMGIDHQWLGFFQFETGAVFTTLGSGGTVDPVYGRAASGQRMPVRVFDPASKWLIVHQDSRPYGTETVLSGEGGEAGTAEAGAGESGAAATRGGPGRGGPGRGGRGGGEPPP